MRCPACGGPLASDGLQFGLYECAQCGEVEVDEGGAYVRGRFYERGDGRGEEEFDDDWNEAAESYVPTWEDVFASEDAASPFED